MMFVNSISAYLSGLRTLTEPYVILCLFHLKTILMCANCNKVFVRKYRK